MVTLNDLTHQIEGLTRHLRNLGLRWRCPDPDCSGLPHAGWTHPHARGSQHEPANYATWAIVTGRGYGKTRTGAETTKGWGLARTSHIAVLAKNEREVRNVCFEGPAGLLSILAPDQIANYARSSGDTTLTLTNGTVFRAFSSESPDNLRGYAFDGAWCDEYAAWTEGSAQDAMDNLWFCLRESAKPRVVVTTTPRPREHVKTLLKQAENDPMTVVTRGTMLENITNLSKGAVDRLLSRYEGTRIGRQELEGELLTDVVGALWTLEMIEPYRLESVPTEAIGRIVVAIDPATTAKNSSDETGIIVAGALTRPDSAHRLHYVILEDISGHYSPEAWAKTASDAATRWGADAIVAETNAGGDMVRTTLAQVQPQARYRPVWASRGKHVRAEPIVALYEQGRVHHVGDFPRLEDQLTTWVPEGAMRSPDRLDALVWALSDLALRHTPSKAITVAT